MGLFYDNNVAGSGVAKHGKQKKPFFRYWEMFANKFWTFFKINLIYFVFCIPIVTFGPATAAMTSLMRNIYLERPQFVFHDFWQAFKKNFKQSFVIGLLDVWFIVMAVFSFFFFTANMENTDKPYWLYYALVMAVEITILLMNFYIFPQIVALNLNLPQILKNSFILAFVNLKGNLVSLAVYLAYITLVMFCLPVLFLLPLMPLAWLAFTSMFTSYPAIQKFIINPFYEQQGLKNPEIPDYDDDDEEVLFEDRGGEEAPLKIKKQDKGGKVIK
ncbi:MAG: YesL family protein [Oscillospiraceae bacterium]